MQGEAQAPVCATFTCAGTAQRRPNSGASEEAATKTQCAYGAPAGDITGAASSVGNGGASGTNGEQSYPVPPSESQVCRGLPVQPPPAQLPRDRLALLTAILCKTIS